MAERINQENKTQNWQHALHHVTVGWSSSEAGGTKHQFSVHQVRPGWNREEKTFNAIRNNISQGPTFNTTDIMVYLHAAPQ